MKILFLNKNFYEYDLNIKKQLEKNGHTVVSFCITPEISITNKIKKTIGFNFNMDEEILKYQRNLLKKLENQSFDLIFVLAGQGLREDTLKVLKNKNFKAVFCWYIWDSIKNLEVYSTIYKYFDVIISFDKLEAEQMKLKYLPLFFIDDKICDEKKYDISMIGQDREYRRKILVDFIRKGGFENYFFYLKTGRIEKLKCLFKRKAIVYKFLNIRSLSYEKTKEIMKKSRIVLDIPAPNQTGLTMRTIETLGSHTKMITTNKYVREYDFYNPNNILIINSENIEIPKDFLQSCYEEVSDSILYNYSLEMWCRKLLCYVEEIR